MLLGLGWDIDGLQSRRLWRLWILMSPFLCKCVVRVEERVKSVC